MSSFLTLQRSCLCFFFFTFREMWTTCRWYFLFLPRVLQNELWFVQFSLQARDDRGWHRAPGLPGSSPEFGNRRSITAPCDYRFCLSSERGSWSDKIRHRPVSWLRSYKVSERRVACYPSPTLIVQSSILIMVSAPSFPPSWQKHLIVVFKGVTIETVVKGKGPFPEQGGTYYHFLPLPPLLARS